MNLEEKNTAVIQNNTFQDIDAMYLSVESNVSGNQYYLQILKSSFYLQHDPNKLYAKNARITHTNL